MPTHRSANGRTAPVKARLGRKLAALAGATGAVAAGTAEAVPYTPTAGVAAAQGIPGFSFDTATTSATLGTLRPPASPGSTVWDIDGVGGADFQLTHSNPFVGFTAARLLQNQSSNSLVGSQQEGFYLQKLQTGFDVAGGVFGSSVGLTFNGVLGNATDFTLGAPGQFGFKFISGEFTHYGWGSLVIDGSPAGQGFQITEAYYQTTPGTPILVGQVPQAVPEPSSMALLAIGAAGVTAWRARRKKAQ